jgi:hypothetical protein
MSREGGRGIRLALLVGLELICLALPGCGNSGPSEVSSQSVGEARHHLFDMLRSRESADMVVPYHDLEGLLPNVSYQAKGFPPVRYTTLVVSGIVNDVTEGYGYVATREDPDGVPTAFDAPNLEWRTIVLTVHVDEVLAGSTDEPNVHISVAINPDDSIEQMRAAYLSLGRLVLPLEHVPSDSVDPSQYWIAHQGSLLITVDGHGGLHLPAFSDADEAKLLGEITTIEDLGTAAAAAPRVILAEREGESGSLGPPD